MSADSLQHVVGERVAATRGGVTISGTLASDFHEGPGYPSGLLLLVADDRLTLNANAWDLSFRGVPLPTAPGSIVRAVQPEHDDIPLLFVRTSDTDSLPWRSVRSTADELDEAEWGGEAELLNVEILFDAGA